MVTRRRFVGDSAALAALVAMSGPAAAAGAAAEAAPRGPLGRSIGLQLYTVREQAASDLPGTLRAIAAMGYREVELAGLYGRGAADFAALLEENGLDAVAAHYSMFDLQEDLDAKLDDLHALTVGYLVCSFPGAPDPSRLMSHPGGPGRAIVEGALSLEDWHWNAEQCERIAAAAAARDLGFAYHNHAMEFASYDGTVAIEELLRLTDAERVFLEVDCAWVAAAGGVPAEFITRHVERVRLLHVKDMKAGTEQFTTTPVGSGAIDWPGVFAAVDPRRLDHYFVEQEHFDESPLAAVEQSIRYLQQLGRGAT